MFFHLCIDVPKRQQLVLKFQLPGNPVLYKVIAFDGMLHGGENIFDEREKAAIPKGIRIF
jgi:hypothetical protein